MQNKQVVMYLLTTCLGEIMQNMRIINIPHSGEMKQQCVAICWIS
jgi:hypothetical protein